MTTLDGTLEMTRKPDESAHEMYCAEVWGGNRAIEEPFSLTGVRGHVFSKPCDSGRGGDIHYISICGSGLISRVCVADVAGHGAAVAKASQDIHDLLRQYMNTLDQRRILRELNQRLEGSKQGRMTTAAVVSYFPPIRLLSVSYAGHEPAWLYRKSEDRWMRLILPSALGRREGLVDMPLAIHEQTGFTRRKERVRPGDRVLLVTDGVLEAPSLGGELFGVQRLERVIHENRHENERALIERIHDALTKHTQDAALSHDDVTMMLLDFVPGPPAFGIWHGLKRRMFRRPKAGRAVGD